MARARESFDPREIITPDSFAVSPELIGWPLARPWRRALAMLVDLMLIGALSLANGLFLGMAVGLVLLRIAFRAQWKASARWARRFLGCIGVLILLATVTAVWLARLATSGQLKIPLDPEGKGGRSVSLSVSGTGLVLTDIGALLRADNDSMARRAADRIVQSLSGAGVSPGEMRHTLRSVVGDSETGRIDRALAAAVGALGREPTPVRPPLDSLLARYQAARTEGDSVAEVGMRDSLAVVLAGDLLAARDRRIDGLEEERGELRGDLRRVKAELEEAHKPPGIWSLLRGIVGDLGLGFGWSGVYFTAFLAMWRGQTPGKRLLGVRVLRLNGRPIGWWIAFERFGGYAASVFTGLLGFLQILWDRNRQGVHDKLTETVVVRDHQGSGSPALQPQRSSRDSRSNAS